MLVEITPKNRLSATKICPELITTRLGIYKKSPMQEFADKKFLTQPGMEKGFSIDNYQSWLNWTYEMLAETKYDDPLTGFARDLEERSDNRFNIIFLMSFSEKGFPSFRKNEKKNSNFKSFSVKLDNTRIDYEREFIRGRFGNPLIIERSYENKKLINITSLYFDSEERLILKLDDPERWGYQQQWYGSLFLAGNKTFDDDLNKFNDTWGPVEYSLGERYLKDLGSGGIAALNRQKKPLKSI